jgi:hypothetical protein
MTSVPMLAASAPPHPPPPPIPPPPLDTHSLLNYGVLYGVLRHECGPGFFTPKSAALNQGTGRGSRERGARQLQRFGKDLAATATIATAIQAMLPMLRSCVWEKGGWGGGRTGSSASASARRSTRMRSLARARNHAASRSKQAQRRISRASAFRLLGLHPKSA